MDLTHRDALTHPPVPSLLRHLVAVLMLPFTVVVLVPWWLTASQRAIDSRWPPGSGSLVSGRVAGTALFGLGLALFAWCVTLFARVGRGTLAPWDPTQRLVVIGPYRHGRNPMITSVALMLAGEAIHLGSRLVAAWLALFVLVNHAYFLLSEEPGLARRFGPDYERYKAAVPRWLPRWKAYDGGAPSGR